MTDKTSEFKFLVDHHFILKKCTSEDIVKYFQLNMIETYLQYQEEYLDQHISLEGPLLHIEILEGQLP